MNKLKIIMVYNYIKYVYPIQLKIYNFIKIL